MIQFRVLPGTETSVALQSRTQMLQIPRGPDAVVGGLLVTDVLLEELAQHRPVQLNQAGAGEALGLAAPHGSTSWTEQYNLYRSFTAPV